MAKTRRSQRVMLDHSKAKVELLEKYLEKYLNIISNDGYTKKIDVYDLFCGEGEYENGGVGSPIAILKVIEELHTINKAKVRQLPKVNVFFNDMKFEKTEKLKKVINDKTLHKAEYGAIHFRNKNYKDIVSVLAQYISSVKTEKAFIFIDPYGYKEIRASEIKELLISGKSEVLLFLPTQFMYRFDDKGTPQALIDILEELVDLHEWKQNNSVYEFIEQFKNALKKYLGSIFVDTFTIEKDEATVFCLFFFSSHIRGFEKMLETKWQIDDDEGKGWSYEKTMNLFASQKTNTLEEFIVQFLSNSNEVVYNGTLYEQTLRQGFLPKHTNEILNAYQEEGKLDVLSPDGDKIRKGAFYINYDSFKVNYKRVYFKIKK